MNITQVRTLLNNFYDGTSTEEQEQALRDYFASTTDLPDDLRADADIFRAMSATHTVPADLEQRIIRATTGRRRFTLKLAASAIGIAASFALIIAIGWKSTPPAIQAEMPHPTIAYTHEVNDPEEARAIAYMAVEQLNESINKINNKLQKITML